MKVFLAACLFLVIQPVKIVSTSSRAVTTSFIPRTCQEGFDSGHPEMQESGMYWIDPDGDGIGQVPIYVHCEKGTPDENGKVHHKTVLMHDKEATFEVKTCIEDNCVTNNEVSFNYTGASNRQMWALAELSNSCEQSIEIKLIRDTLEENIWWKDRFGANYYFWHGEYNENLKHTCKCGLDSSCFDSSKKCNCDAAVAIPVSDKGNITDKDLLPVTVLHLGKIEYEGGEVTLGRFTCTGSLTLANENGQPTSCRDLWALGHTLNGIYTIKNPTPDPAVCKNVPLLLLYCDFRNLQGDLVELVHEEKVATSCAQPVS